jgi:Ca2+-binding RTX toxin-like protein
MTEANLIFLGNFPLIDLVENNRNAERAATLLGASADSESLLIVPVMLDDGGDGRVDTDDFGTDDTFTYDLGAGSVTQKTDAIVLGVVRVLDAMGNASEVNATVIQAQNGDVFLADRPGRGLFDDRDISSVEIVSVSNSLGRGWSADQSVDGSRIVEPSGGPPTSADGVVDGEAAGETMGLGYDDSNPPTDQGGDRITIGPDIIFGNGGADTIDGDSGDDVIYGDGDPEQSASVAIQVVASDAGFKNGLLAYTIDVESGTISNLTLLTPNVTDAIGSTFVFTPPAGSVVGIGIRSPEGDFLSSGYGDNRDLNPDGRLHTQLIEQRSDSSVVLGFEDRFNLGDQDFDDVLVRVDLGASGATLDNAHIAYCAPMPGGVPGDDTIFGGRGNDTIFGQAGGDNLYGEEDDDDIFGGTGDDAIDGGSGADTLYGGDGADTIRLGLADDDDQTSPVDGNADVAHGQDGADTFLQIGVGDFVEGGAGGLDGDTLDLRGSAPPGGSLSVNRAGTDSDGNGYDGTVDYYDSNRTHIGSSTFVNMETIIPCFTAGTLIATETGEMPVEALAVGDRIVTRDSGAQFVRWIGRRRMTRAELALLPHLRPVRIRRGALGEGRPERDMVVSPNHRFLVASGRSALYFEESEVLVAAKHLVVLDGVEIADVDEVEFVHVMFDRHEVILSDGVWTESFQPGDQTLSAMGKAQRSELLALFPDLRTPAGIEAYAAARRSLKKHEAKLLVLQ